MTAKEAAKFLRNKYMDMSIIGCFEFPDFYAFAMVDKGFENELWGGGYYTIGKKDGKLGGISSLALSEVFESAKPIDISTLD